MSTENIRINYVVDKKQLDASNKSLEETAKLNNLTQKEVDDTNEKFEDQSKVLATNNKALSGLGGQLTAIGNKFQIAGKGAGDMAAGLFKTTAATNATSKSMRLLKIAIASTGIGLLVIALGSLVTFFTKTQKGSDLLAKSMAAMGAIVTVITSKFAEFGKAIVSAFENPKAAIMSFVNLVKENVINRFNGLLELIPQLGKAINQLFSGDFAGAAETAGNAVAKVTLGVEDFTQKLTDGIDSAKESISELSKEIDGAVAGAGRIVALQIKIREAEIAITSATADRSREIQDLLIITRDFSQEFSVQQEALAKANELELANQKDLVGFANLKLQLARTELNETPKALQLDEQRLAVAQAQAEVSNAIAGSTAKQREILNRVTELTNRQIAAETKLATEKQAAIDIQIEAETNLTIFRLEQFGLLEEAELAKRERLLENELLLAEERELIIGQSEANIREIRKASSDFEKELNTELVESKKAGLNQGLSTLRDVAGRESAIGRGAAVAQAGINTAQAITKALASLPPPFSFIVAALTGVLGAVQVAKIAGITPSFEKGGKIGGNLHSSGGTVIEAERDEFVMSRKATSKYGFDFMDKINNLELRPEIISGKTGGSSITVVDTNPIANQLKKMPTNVVNIDGAGYTAYQRRQNATIVQKANRYSV